MKNTYFKVEFDPTYFGGNYESVGNFALVPEDLVTDLGMAEAFSVTTGHKAENIVHFSEDARFDARGKEYEFEIDLPKVETVQIPETETIQIPAIEMIQIEKPAFAGKGSK